jgi:archaellum component FlaC
MDLCIIRAGSMENKRPVKTMKNTFLFQLIFLALVLPASAGSQVLDAIDIHLTLREKEGGDVRSLPNARLQISDIGEVTTNQEGQYSFTYPVRNEVDPAISISLLSEKHQMLKPLDGALELDPTREEMYIDFLVVNMESESPEFKERIAGLEKQIAGLKAKNKLTSQQLNALNSTLLDTILYFEANRRQLESEIAGYEKLTSDQQAEISTLQNKVDDLAREVDRLTLELEQALEEQFLRQNEYFRDISSSLLNYLRKAKDLRDHLPYIKSYFNSAGGFQSFSQDIHTYNKVWETFDANRLSYLEGVERYWEDPVIVDELEDVFDFMVNGIHQTQILNIMRDINEQLHKQNPGKAQKIATLAYDDMSVNVLALEKRINRSLTQLRKNI